MRIEHRYFVLNQKGEMSNVHQLNRLILEGWLPSRETPLEGSFSPEFRFRPETQEVSGVGHHRYSHCLILLYKESK